MDIFETHIALRVASFRGALEKLHAAGFHEDLPDDHPLKIVIKPHPPTGYPQVYFFDPDRRLIGVERRHTRLSARPNTVPFLSLPSKKRAR